VLDALTGSRLGEASAVPDPLVVKSNQGSPKIDTPIQDRNSSPAGSKFAPALGGKSNQGSAGIGPALVQKSNPQVTGVQETENTVHVYVSSNIPQNIELLKENELLKHLATELQDWDKGSHYNWREAIRALGRETIEVCLRDTITAYHQGKVKKNKVRYFMWLVKQVAEERGIQLWHRHQVKPEDEVREQPAPGLADLKAEMVMKGTATVQSIRASLQEENNS